MNAQYGIALGLIVLFIAESVTSEGALSVKFLFYDNPSGNAANGNCCDGRGLFCQNQGCDYIFKLCLDDGKSANNTAECRYGYKESTKIRDKDSLIFDKLIGNLENPTTFWISGPLPDQLVLKVAVFDCDAPHAADDFVDFLRIPVENTRNLQSFAAYGARRQASTRLRGEFELSCSVDCGRNGSGTSTTTTHYTGVVFIDRPNADCDNLARNGHRYKDGVYSLRVAYFEPFDAYCDMSDEGWTVIQRRVDGSENFDRSIQHYIRGFGKIGDQTEYWLGLKKIYWLTNQRSYRLRITMQKADGGFVFAEYDRFNIDENYVLHVSGYSGTAGNALNNPIYGGMRIHNGMPFSTFDSDNDNWPAGNCGQMYESGWWFNDCYRTNLNGRYRPVVNGWPYCEQGKCISWQDIQGYESFSLIRTEMKILPHRE